MGGSRAERAGAPRRARGWWTGVLGQPRGACHAHRHAVLASCRGAAWCPHKSPDPQLLSLMQGAGPTERCVVTRGGQSDATSRCHGCRRNYRHRSPGARGWALSTHGYSASPTNHDFDIGRRGWALSTHGSNVLRTMISALSPRHDMRYDGRLYILARSGAAHAPDNGWVGIVVARSCEQILRCRFLR